MKKARSSNAMEVKVMAQAEELRPAAPRSAARRPGAARPASRRTAPAGAAAHGAATAARRSAPAGAAAQSAATAARRTAPALAAPRPGEAPTTRDRAAGISDDAVRARTGKGWNEWFSLLDGAGAREWNHTQIARHLYEKLSCPGWWNQMVAVGYEQARGLREKNQTPEGYAVSATRTYAAPVAKVFGCWNDPKRRFRWLDDANITVRKANPARSLRIAWKGGESRVEVSFYEKGTARAQVTVDHKSLARRRDVVRMKTFWTKQLDSLTEFLKP